MKKLLFILLISIGLIHSAFSITNMINGSGSMELFKHYQYAQDFGLTNYMKHDISLEIRHYVMDIIYPGSKEINYYNLEVYQEWNGSSWDNQEKTEHHYDGIGNEVEQLMYEWDGSAWVYSLKNVITYGGNGLPQYMMIQMWDASNNVWVDMGKMTFTFNAQNQLTEMLMQYYLGMWINAMRMTYSYNGQGLGTQILEEEWDMVGSIWVNSYKETFTYNASNLCTEELNQYWENNTWVNEDLYLNTYDGGGHMTTKLLRSWVNNAWIDYMKFTYTYNGQWNVTQELTETWNGASWGNFMMLYNTYDAQQRITEELEKIWENSAWVNEDVTTWTYGIPAGLGEGLSMGTVEVYPNPATDHVSVDAGTFTGELTLSMFDLGGREVKRWNCTATTGKVIVQLDGIEPGVYFLSVKKGNEGTLSRKLTVVR